MQKSTITIDVNLDENNVPEKLNWSATDSDDKGKADALLLSIWDENEANTLRIDLWTKDMTVDQMQKFFHQTMATMADTYARATSDDKHADMIRNFSDELGVSLGLFSK